MNKSELQTLLAESLAESKADPNPGFHLWNSWPQGNMAHRSWKVREYRRSTDRRTIRRLLRKLRLTTIAA